jgi:nitroreductase
MKPEPFGSADSKRLFSPLIFDEQTPSSMAERAHSFYSEMASRRTTRHFSQREVPKNLIDLAVKTAGTAPSGAHLQPWTFVAISNVEMKQRIREAAEQEEERFYTERIPEAWKEVLEPLGTDHIKEHISDAPWLVVLFRHTQRVRSNGEMAPTYYSQESCGIAAGLFIAAIHRIGLVTLTHTPSPMGFLRNILCRPEHESAMLLMPVGYPRPDATVPDLVRKGLDEILLTFE